MRVIDHRRLQKRTKKLHLRYLTWALYGVVSVAALLVIANFATMFIYKGKVLPHTTLGRADVGGMRLSELEEKVGVSKVLPEQITIYKTKSDSFQATISTLGIRINWKQASQELGRHGWFPLFSLLGNRHLPAPVTFHPAEFKNTTDVLGGIVTQSGIVEHIEIKDGVFVVVPAQGATTLDVPLFKARLLEAFAAGRTSVLMPYIHEPTPAPNATLPAAAATLQKGIDSTITIVHAEKKKQLSKGQLASVYAASGQTMVVSQYGMDAVLDSVGKEFGIVIISKAAATSAMRRALERGEPASIALVASTDTVTRRYCTAVRGVDAGALGELNSKLSAVYSDPRGWNMGGRVAFAQTAAGCDYTVWLSASAEMTSFGGVCDNYYSCRSGNNVVINYDRWMGATEPWNAAGGSLEDYRAMVINHETGHWLGFGHRTCPGAGQPAPVMQQQSISLGGCTFNPWPTAAELATLKQTLGI